MTDFSTRRRVMVDSQVRPSDVTKFPIIEAMLSVPREVYVPEAQAEAAYVSECVDLGEGRVLLEPRTFSKMLDALNLQNGELVLDLGCGLGYSSAVIARMVDAVVAVEEDAAMAADAQANLSGNDVDNAAVIEGALAAGAAKHGPYDVIIIEGGVEEIPAAITDQLRDGGRIVAIFMEGSLGICRLGVKSGDEVAWRFAFNATAPVLPGFSRQVAFAL